MSINKTTIGHLSCLGAYLIFGLNLVLCKGVSQSGLVSPIALFCMRSLGATVLFWLISLFMPRERMTVKDLGLTFLASMLGLFLTQISFLEAITMTTAIDASIISTMTPIMTMFVAAIFVKEPITWRKAGGVMTSLLGVLFLIFNMVSMSSGAEVTKPLGILLMLGNGFFFALYLGIFRPLIQRYSVVTFMKWMFLWSLVASLPFGARDLVSIDYASMPSNVVWSIAYVVFFATFVAYFLVPVGQKYLRPTIVSLYNYVQPIIAMLISIVIGMDHLTWQKAVACVLVFAGVYIVNRSRAAGQGKG